MDDDSIMFFGIHAGKKMANVPNEYLKWLWENNKCFGPLKKYIRENLDTIIPKEKEDEKGVEL